VLPATALAGEAWAQPAKDRKDADSGSARTFPDGFFWGTATSAYQIEGWQSRDTAKAFANRFGLVYVDFKVQKRSPKLSAAWFREAAMKNCVV
jgi:beta-glucosidase/6-phospho-beta-glucosidase/beta-galactosidase